MFLSGQQLSIQLRNVLGTSFNASRVKEAAYELSLGGQVYRTDSPTKKREILDIKDSQVIINPGQFALLITDETVSIPNKLIGLISVKFSQKIKGLVNVSGFHVDPGFSGKIIFSVYNAGPTPILMDKGKPYFLLWLCEISDPITYNGNHNNQSEISAELIEQLKGEIASPNALLAKITETETSFNQKIAKLDEVKARNQWLLTFLIVIVAGLAVKAYWDWDSYYKGKVSGLEEKTALEEIKTSADKYKLDSVFLQKIDSILTVKLNQDSVKDK